MLLVETILVDERIRRPRGRLSCQRWVRRSSRDVGERVGAVPYHFFKIFMDFYIHKADFTFVFGAADKRYSLGN